MLLNLKQLPFFEYNHIKANNISKTYHACPTEMDSKKTCTRVWGMSRTPGSRTGLNEWLVWGWMSLMSGQRRRSNREAPFWCATHLKSLGQLHFYLQLKCLNLLIHKDFTFFFLQMSLINSALFYYRCTTSYQRSILHCHFRLPCKPMKKLICRTVPGISWPPKVSGKPKPWQPVWKEGPVKPADESVRYDQQKKWVWKICVILF